MKNSKLILGIAAGAAVAAGVALIVAKKRKSYLANAEEAKEHYGSRLKKLQRKALKEFKESGDNTAMERASQWAGHIPGGLR